MFHNMRAFNPYLFRNRSSLIMGFCFFVYGVKNMKRMIGLISILVAFLGVAFFVENKPQHNKVPRIGVLTLMHHPSLDQIYDGFIKELAAQGYHNGKNIQIKYQNAQGDQGNMQTMANKLVDDNPDVLYAITTPSTQAIANLTHTIPLVFSGVTNPKQAKLVQSDKYPGSNVTGVSDQAPVREQLELYKKFMPKNAKFGIIYTSSDSSASVEHDEFVKIAKQMHINLQSYSIANSNDLNQVSQTMLQQVDAVIVPTDNTIAGAMQTLVKNADAVKKPIFPAADSMVKQGGVATYGVNQEKLGRLGAKMVVSILKGKSKPATMPIEYIKQGEPILNLKQAKKLGIVVPKSFLNKAQKKGTVYR